MRAVENEKQLILDDNPGWALLFKMFLIPGVLIFIVTALGGFADYGRMWKYALFAGAAIVGLVLWRTLSHSVSEIIIDSQTKIVAHKRRGLFKKSDKIYPFNEIAGFFVRQGNLTKMEGNRPVWLVELKLTSGETVEITTVWNFNETEATSVADAANAFLRK